MVDFSKKAKSATATATKEPAAIDDVPFPNESDVPVVPTSTGMLSDDEALLDDYAEDLTESRAIPYCQVLALPKMSLTELARLNKSFGFFLPKDEALKAGFTPDSRWEHTSITFGDEDDENATATEGFVCKHPRFAIVHRSQSEVQQKVTQNGKTYWKIIDFEYKNRMLTEAGHQAKEHKDKGLNKEFRTIKRLLLVFLDDNNNPLHGGCIKLTIRGGFAGAFSTEMNAFYKDVSDAYIKLLRSRNPQASGNLNYSAKARVVVDLKFTPFKTGTNNPYTVIAERQSPVVPVGERVEKVDDQDRKVLLVGTRLSDILLRKDHTAALVLGMYFDEFQWFTSLGGRDAETTEEEPMVPLESNPAWLKFKSVLAKAQDAPQVQKAQEWVLADNQFNHLSGYPDIRSLISQACSDRNKELDEAALEDEF